MQHRYEDQGRTRPIIHRASTVEIIVPYGDPRSPFHKKCAFDVVVSLPPATWLLSIFDDILTNVTLVLLVGTCTRLGFCSSNLLGPQKASADLQDYGLGFSCSSLALGCDCLGHIKYFPAILNTNKGSPCPLTEHSSLS